MGTDESSVFDATADYEQTRMDYYEVVFDRWLAAPAKILWDDYRGRFGLIIVSLYVLAAVVGVYLVPEPHLHQGGRLVSPLETLAHPLGTDGLGQDLLGLMVHATPDMLKMIISGAIFGNILGVTVGLISGYKGGTIDKVLMTMTDTLMSIPGIPLLIVLAAILQPTNPFLIGIILNIQGWTGQARSLRSQVLPLAEIEHLEAARAQGQSESNLLVKEILPHLLPLIFIGFLGGAVGIITASVGLYFLGILPFTTMNWGIVLNQAYQDTAAMYSLGAAHWLAVPLLTIVLLNVALVMLAQAFDQVFNPRVRSRHLAERAEREVTMMETEDEDTFEDGSHVIGGGMQR